MAKRIALPDGSIGEFPDAMPDSEIETVLRRQFGGPSTDRFTAGTAAARAADQGIADKAQADADAVNAYRLASADKSQPPGVAEQFLGGAKHAWDRAAMGVKGLVTGLTPEEEQLLSQGKAFVKGTGPASTVGQIAADVGMSLAPVARGAQVLTKTLSGLGRAAPVVADIATNAGYAAATAPEDRGEAMAWGGGGAAFGQMLPRAVARLVKPYNPGKGTQALIDAGVTPTLGDAMAADQRALGAAVVRSGERLVESTPLAGSVLRSTRQRALDDFQRATREAALPPGASKEAAATIDSLGEAFGKAYADTLSQVPFPAKAFAVFQPLKAVDEAVVGTTLTPRRCGRAIGARSALDRIATQGACVPVQEEH
jgi:hypothetical protein